MFCKISLHKIVPGTSKTASWRATGGNKIIQTGRHQRRTGSSLRAASAGVPRCCPLRFRKVSPLQSNGKQAKDLEYLRRVRVAIKLNRVADFQLFFGAFKYYQCLLVIQMVGHIQEAVHLRRMVMQRTGPLLRDVVGVMPETAALPPRFFKCGPYSAARFNRSPWKLSTYRSS